MPKPGQQQQTHDTLETKKNYTTRQTMNVTTRFFATKFLRWKFSSEMMLRPVDASCHLFSYQVEKQHLRPTLLHQAEPLHTMIPSDKILSAWSEKELCIEANCSATSYKNFSTKFWTSLIQFDLVWSSLNKFDQFGSSLNQFDQKGVTNSLN